MILYTRELSARIPDQAPTIRGVAVEESQPLDGLSAGVSSLLYIPRQLINGTLYSAGKTAAFLSDPDFIEKVEDILYLYERDLAWFPTLEFASGARPVYGGGLYYRRDQIKALTRMSGYDSNYWEFDSKVSYEHELDADQRWKTSIRTLFEVKDNLRYYGIGSDPDGDARNQFISDTDSGTFTQDRRKLEWQSSYHPDKNWKFSYLGFLQRRNFKDHGRSKNDFREVFRAGSVPGFTNGAPVSQIYDEFSVGLDTRNNQKMLSSGYRGEIYTGISNGLGANDSDLLRMGADFSALFPTIKEDRLIVPRVVLDIVEDLDNTPIPFSEYPRQLTFRGTSSRDIIRSEQVSMVPSLEYQWPLSHMLSGHIFYDHLVVGEQITNLDWKDSLWAVGLGINFHYHNKEYGRIHCAVGSEGLEFKLSIGSPMIKNNRRDW